VFWFRKTSENLKRAKKRHPRLYVLPITPNLDYCTALLFKKLFRSKEELFIPEYSWISNFSITCMWYNLALDLLPPGNTDEVGSKMRRAVMYMYR
jgi:hypothetical protein